MHVVHIEHAQPPRLKEISPWTGRESGTGKACCSRSERRGRRSVFSACFPDASAREMRRCALFAAALPFSFSICGPSNLGSEEFQSNELVKTEGAHVGQNGRQHLKHLPLQGVSYSGGAHLLNVLRRNHPPPTPRTGTVLKPFLLVRTCRVVTPRPEQEKGTYP